MEALSIAVRTVHFTALMMLCGELLFFLGVARPVERAAGQPLLDEADAFRRRLIRLSFAWLLVAVASGVLWLIVQAADMSGVSIERAVNRDTLGAVLGQTLFGHVWLARGALAVVLATLLGLVQRKMVPERTALGACALLAAGLLAGLVLVGHANSERGSARIVHQVADAVHLVAAALWLGSLVPLAHLLAWAQRRAKEPGVNIAGPLVTRFSLVAMISVAAILVTGTVNSWYTVRTVPGLLGTPYGHLLLAKVALVAIMVGFAVFNRLRLTPRVLDLTRAMLRSWALGLLSRNATTEAVLGIGVIALVGALGVAVPAMHSRTVWPLPFTFDWQAKRFVEAYPTTYLTSPSGYTAESVARGLQLYSQHCAACHGLTGKGDGPAAAASDLRPADLRVHFHFHRQGDILWWIEHGIDGTRMPAFGGSLSRSQSWDVVNALRAKADAHLAHSMGDAAVPTAIPAPDFTFQVDGHPQERLSERRGREDVLLVFYKLPASVAQLSVLGACRDSMHEDKLRVVAVPIGDIHETALLRGIEPSILADATPAVANAYAAFGLSDGYVSPAPEPMAFLVDRHGNLRARWTQAEAVNCGSLSGLVQRTDSFNIASSPEAAHAH